MAALFTPDSGDCGRRQSPTDKLRLRLWLRHAPCLLCAAAALVAGCLALCFSPSDPIALPELLQVFSPDRRTHECCASRCPERNPSARDAVPAPLNQTQCSRDVVAGRLCECLVQGTASRAPHRASEVAAMDLSVVRQHIITELNSAGFCTVSDCSKMPEKRLADLCLPCSEGYLQMLGSLPATASGERVHGCEQCADRCSGSATCRSYECSKTELMCRINEEAEPSNVSAYKDFVFCSKEVAVLPEIDLRPQASARRLLQRQSECDCSRCQTGINALLLQISELAKKESRQLSELKGSGCKDEPNWIDPVSGTATCPDWKGFDCSADFGKAFSQPSVIVEKCPRTCGMCTPVDMKTVHESETASPPDATSVASRQGARTPAPAPTVIRYIDVKSGQAFYGPAAGGQRVFKNPWETRYDDPFGFKENAILEEKSARREWDKFDSFMKLQRQGGVEEANAEAEDMVRLRRQGLSTSWIRKLPPLVYQENHWFKRRKWKGDSEDGEVVQGRDYVYRHPPPVRTRDDSPFVTPESVPIITTSMDDLLSGKGQ